MHSITPESVVRRTPESVVRRTPDPSSRRHRRLARTSALAAVTVALAGCGAIQSRDEGGDAGSGADYPTKEITMVVPFSAGGPTDTVTRLISEPMSKTLGQQIVVQNVEGAGGTVASGQVANAGADGYEVLVHHIGMSTAPSLYPDLPYKPEQDFATIGRITDVPMTIVAKKGLAPNTLQELVAYITANPGKVTIATAGVGAASQLCGLLIEEAVGVDLTEVPYKGTGPALTDLVGGQVDLMCDQTTNTTSQITAKKVKGYAVTTDERLDVLPDLPTTAEGGLPDVSVSVWHGMYAPKGTPDDVVKKLTDALAAALKDPKVIDEMAKLGTAPVPAGEVTPEAHSRQLTEQIAFWKPKIEAAGIKAGG
ncbi:MAG: tripartite tricarboxylate transporter substrate-binding protein [Dermatophilaceae bacterium]